jgi:hypothetical protein
MLTEAYLTSEGRLGQHWYHHPANTLICESFVSKSANTFCLETTGRIVPKTEI